MKHITSHSTRQRRAAAAVVEMAVVISLFLFVLFGIVEYCRFIFVRQVMTNAAREGARFAVVNTLATELESSTKARVQQHLKTIGSSLSNSIVKVYNGDASGNYKGPAGDAEFGEYIVVQIDGNFQSILPSFLHMENAFNIRTKALMYSEAN